MKIFWDVCVHLDCRALECPSPSRRFRIRSSCCWSCDSYRSGRWGWWSRTRKADCWARDRVRSHRRLFGWRLNLIGIRGGRHLSFQIAENAEIAFSHGLNQCLLEREFRFFYNRAFRIQIGETEEGFNLFANSLVVRPSKRSSWVVAQGGNCCAGEGRLLEGLQRANGRIEERDFELNQQSAALRAILLR